MLLRRMQSAFAVSALTLTTLADSEVRAADPYENAPPYAIPVDAKARLHPLVTTGQQIPLTGGLPGEVFRVVGIPDGMGIYGRGPKRNHQLILQMNHEFRQFQGTPFGSLPSGARASKFIVDYKKGGAKSSATFVSGNLAFERVFDGETGAEILPIKGISRLCSAFLENDALLTACVSQNWNHSNSASMRCA